MAGKLSSMPRTRTQQAVLVLACIVFGYFIFLLIGQRGSILSSNTEWSPPAFGDSSINTTPGPSSVATAYTQGENSSPAVTGYTEGEIERSLPALGDSSVNTTPSSVATTYTESEISSPAVTGYTEGEIVPWDDYVHTLSNTLSCPALDIKAAFQEKPLAAFLLKRCRFYKKEPQILKYKGEYLYLPQESRVVIGPGGPPKKLMIVAHPDDEVIFGGDDLIMDRAKGGWVVVYVTQDFTRTEMVNQMTRHWNFSMAVHYAVADSSQADLKYHVRFVEALQRLVCSNKWETVVYHGQKGEYGHNSHRALHMIVSTILAKAGIHSDGTTEIRLFDAEPPKPQLPTEERVKEKRSTLIDIYNRPYQRWADLSATCTSVRYTKTIKVYPIGYHLCS